MTDVKIVPVTKENRKIIENLKVKPEQEGNIETVAECLEEADENEAWKPGGIYCGGRLVGFTMYGYFDEPCWGGRLWFDRFLIADSYQGKGYGTYAARYILNEMFQQYKTQRIYLSVYETNVAAIHLYKMLGFSFTGEYDTKGEKVMALDKTDFYK